MVELDAVEKSAAYKELPREDTLYRWGVTPQQCYVQIKNF